MLSVYYIRHSSIMYNKVITKQLVGWLLAESGENIRVIKYQTLNLCLQHKQIYAAKEFTQKTLYCSLFWCLKQIYTFILQTHILQYLEWPLNTRRRDLELASNSFIWHSSPPTHISLPSDLKFPPYAFSRKRFRFFWTTFVIGLYIWT